MILRNTSRYPDSEVRDLVKFACKGFNDKRVCINVKNCNTSIYRGRAYGGVPYISNAPKSSKYLVVIRIGSPDRFPTQGNGGYKRVPDFEIKDWKEALVAIVAHELTHIKQYRYGKRRSEVKCEMAEIKKLQEYRNR